MSQLRETNPAYYTLLLTSLTAFLAYTNWEPTITSQRPKGTKSDAGPGWGDQTVLARMWEDPVSAQSAPNITHATCADLTNQISRWREDMHEVRVMGVFIEGSPFAEETEVRLRLRYAAQNALLDSRCVPADRNHLGLWTLDWPKATLWTNRLNLSELLPPVATSSVREASLAWQATKAMTNTTNTVVFEVKQANPSSLSIAPASSPWGALDVPFEWFTRGVGTNKQAILVLWLKEEAFPDHPFQRLYWLAKQLGQTNTNSASFWVVGPRSSNTLYALIEDAIYLAPAPWLSNFFVVSPEASAPDAVLDDLHAETWELHRKYTEFCFRALAIGGFSNLIQTDDELATNLVTELQYRGVNIGKAKSDQMVLISESDTVYGRSLPSCFAAACATAQEHWTNENEWISQLRSCLTNIPPPLHRYTYLRGLDGGTALRADSDSGSKPLVGRPDSRTGADGGNRAEGDSQLDYARRLASQIKADLGANRSLRAQPRAIGILGNDFYDKLILLQALRPTFKDSIFFTTDLDARFWDSHALPYTRNLIVASSYGLKPTANELPDARSNSLTPFRDCYQTAVYLACRHVLGADATMGINRVFEIGLNGPIELGRSDAEWRSDALHKLLLIALLVLGVSAPFVLLFRWIPGFFGSVSKQVMERENDEIERINQQYRRRLLWLGFGAVAGLIVLGLLAAYQSAQPSGEPFTWFDGVSIWPTLLLRVLIIFLELAFLVRAWHLHRCHRICLRRDFFGEQEKFNESHLYKEVLTKPEWFYRVTRSIPESKISRKSWLYRGLYALFFFEQGRGAISINRWKTPRADKPAGASATWEHGDSPVPAVKVYNGYLTRGMLSSRFLRLLPVAIVYLVAAILIMGYFGLPLVPARGMPHWGTAPAFLSLLRGVRLVGILDFALLLGVLLGYCILVFYVVDAVRLSRRMIAMLSEGPTIWPKRVLRDAAIQQNMDPKHLGGFLDVKFTAAHTQRVYHLVFFPMIILCLMFIARSSVFDGWTWPPTLVVMFVVNAAIILFCVISIRQAARKVSRLALAELQEIKARHLDGAHQWNLPFGSSALPEPAKSASKYGDHIQLTIEEITNIHEGAYAPWPADLAVIAGLIPTAGYGLLEIMQRFLF